MEGTRVLITGAARGIGAATARVLAARGARVALIGLEPELLSELATELGARHAWFEADVTDQAALEAAVEDAVAELGGIDVVVANAGIAPFGTVATGDPEEFARTIDVNLTGVVRTVRATAPQVIANRGYYLLMSSASAFAGVPGIGVYAATKAGVESLANTMRLEMGDDGVAVGAAHPGWIDTEMTRDGEAENEGFRRFRSVMPWPLKDTTSVEECAEALADAIERRRRRVYVPRGIALAARLRRSLTSAAGERFMRRRAGPAIAAYEREITATGSGLVGRAREVERSRE
jgi:NAD(P)-dependent dehydrogenase (short-subunit alcohol dehydrogenase family)